MLQTWILLGIKSQTVCVSVELIFQCIEAVAPASYLVLHLPRTWCCTCLVPGALVSYAEYVGTRQAQHQEC
jgi:hypothetical protein